MYLNCHSYHSLRYGTLPPAELVNILKSQGVEQAALTDINNVSAMPLFVKLCRQHGIDPVAGVECRENGKIRYVLLARNPDGFTEINQILTRYKLSNEALPVRFPAGHNVFVVYPFEALRCEEGIQAGLNRPTEMEYIGVMPRDIPLLYQGSWQKTGPGMQKMVALNPVSFRDATQYKLHRYLRAIDNNLLLSHLSPAHTGMPQDVVVGPDQIKKRYGAFAFLSDNANKLLQSCRMDFDFHSMKNKRSFTGDPVQDRALLAGLAQNGLLHRYGSRNQEAARRVKHELEIIDRLGFCAYFLITHDIIRYSMSRGFYHVGRGSGANSIVAYCLRITDVDPIELDLYFERFINPKRSSPPDFDIDFSWKDRDQVLEYIFGRYGNTHTALLGTSVTFRRRSIIRELGKVTGLPKGEIDLLAEGRPQDSAAGDSLVAVISSVGEQLADFPNIRSIHAGGVLISEAPVCSYSILDLPPKGFPTVQWDMYTAEDLGFEKIDILSQRGIGHINECVEIVKKNRKITVDAHQIERFKNDPAVRQLLRSGETTGCFYVESPAMRGLLKKLRCDTYLTLVAASSIIRPGVARSGMMKEYIRRFHNPGSSHYLHPILEDLLKETYGVMVYQEDVIKVCHHFAGLDLADADVLRRAMSGKYRSREEMQRITDRFFSGCQTKGYPETLSREVWRQIESFAGYSFSKAHSASFAAESFQSLYLKAYFPLEFMTAVINNFGGFYSAQVYFNEARRLGAQVLPPCVNHSERGATIKGRDIYAGFVHIMNLEQVFARTIVKERERNGPYRNLYDFATRTRAEKQQLLLLIRANALRFTGIPKAKLMWEACLIGPKKAEASMPLFVTDQRPLHYPEPDSDSLQDAYDEIELIGFSLSHDPFSMLRTSFRGDIFAGDMLKNTGKRLRMLGLLVAIKYVRTVNRDIMHFGCFLDARGEFFDTVHFPKSVKEHPFCGNGIYLISGILTEEFGFPSLTVEKMARMPLKPDPRQ